MHLDGAEAQAGGTFSKRQQGRRVGCLARQPAVESFEPTCINFKSVLRNGSARSLWVGLASAGCCDRTQSFSTIKQQEVGRSLAYAVQ
jgi:hypothetical protein